jgi:hypothetical protein
LSVYFFIKIHYANIVDFFIFFFLWVIYLFEENEDKLVVNKTVLSFGINAQEVSGVVENANSFSLSNKLVALKMPTF